MSKPFTPMSTPAAWRSFMYDNVLVPWETGTLNICKDTYRKTVIESVTGIQVLKIEKLNDLQPVEEQFKRSKDDFLAFYCDGKGYEALFKRLRDTTAHAHYYQQPAGSIVLRHSFKGRADKKARLRLIGQLKFTTLKKLISFLHDRI